MRKCCSMYPLALFSFAAFILTVDSLYVARRTATGHPISANVSPDGCATRIAGERNPHSGDDTDRSSWIPTAPRVGTVNPRSAENQRPLDVGFDVEYFIYGRHPARTDARTSNYLVRERVEEARRKYPREDRPLFRSAATKAEILSVGDSGAVARTTTECEEDKMRRERQKKEASGRVEGSPRRKNRRDVGKGENEKSSRGVLASSLALHRGLRSTFFAKRSRRRYLDEGTGESEKKASVEPRSRRDDEGVNEREEGDGSNGAREMTDSRPNDARNMKKVTAGIRNRRESSRIPRLALSYPRFPANRNDATTLPAGMFVVENENESADFGSAKSDGGNVKSVRGPDLGTGNLHDASVRRFVRISRDGERVSSKFLKRNANGVTELPLHTTRSSVTESTSMQDPGSDTTPRSTDAVTGNGEKDSTSSVSPPPDTDHSTEMNDQNESSYTETPKDTTDAITETVDLKDDAHTDTKDVEEKNDVHADTKEVVEEDNAHTDSKEKEQKEDIHTDTNKVEEKVDEPTNSKKVVDEEGDIHSGTEEVEEQEEEDDVHAEYEGDTEDDVDTNSKEMEEVDDVYADSKGEEDWSVSDGMGTSESHSSEEVRKVLPVLVEFFDRAGDFLLGEVIKNLRIRIADTNLLSRVTNYIERTMERTGDNLVDTMRKIETKFRKVLMSSEMKAAIKDALFLFGKELKN